MRRRATTTSCPQCRQLVIAGLDDNALDIHADPIPLTPTGELEAILTGRATWRLDTDHWLWRTSATRITTRPAPGDHLLAGHQCGNPVPAAWTQPIGSTPTPTVDPDQEPPW